MVYGFLMQYHGLVFLDSELMIRYHEFGEIDSKFGINALVLIKESGSGFQDKESTRG